MLVAACTAEPEPDPRTVERTDASPADTSPAVVDPAASVEAEWTVADTRVERPYTGAALLAGVRTARHEEFDRIVFDFGADSVPSYTISYIDRPIRQCGSGAVVPFAGDAWLSIVVQPANAHTEAGEPTITERAQTPSLPVLLELKLICDFEAMVEWVAGVVAPEPYRAFVLRSPNRLVIDIRHPGTR